MEQGPRPEVNEIRLYEAVFSSALTDVLEARKWTAVHVESQGSIFTFVPVELEGSNFKPVTPAAVDELITAIKAELTTYDWSEAITTEETQDGLTVVVDYAEVQKI